jgi:N utilization substance protein B
MGKRSKARECAVQMLYQWETTQEPMDRVSGLFWQVRGGTDDMKAMAERLARGAQANLARLDQLIQEAATHWRVDRMAAVDLDILRIGTYELLLELATPSAVIIDEAVEMAKRFGEADSPGFVNGVLDAVKRGVREGGTRAEPGPRKAPGPDHG